MKKIFFTLFLAIMATTGLYAQQISVVSSNGSTTLFQTLPEAIEGADPGSVIYLPGGSFPISNKDIITKKLTIIGIGHRLKSGNTDGTTYISGNLIFGEGSSSSAVMGCYVTGGISISVNDVLIRNCNLRGISVSSNSIGTTINQSFFRGYKDNTTDYWRIHFGGTSCNFTNNVCFAALEEMNGGIISNNIITEAWYNASICNCNNTIISNNILFHGHSGNNQQVSGNMTPYEWGENCINVEGVNWNDVFINYNQGGISSSSDFHFKDAYKQYENQVGIYAGTGFKDSGMAPVPYIAAKQIPDQTDASGKLNIKIRVKAGE